MRLCLHRPWGLLVLALAGSSWAEEPARPAPAEAAPVTSSAGADPPARRGPPEGPTVQVTLRAETATQATFDDRSARGRLRHDRVALTLTPAWGLADGGGLLFGELGVEWTGYDVSRRALRADGAAPLDDAWQLDLGLGARLPLARGWGLFATFGVRNASEDGRMHADALTARGLVIVQWAVAERLSLTFGAIVRTRLEEDPLVIPAIGFEWRPTDAVTLRTQGPGIEVALTPMKELELTLGVRGELREYRLRREHPTSRGVLRDRQFPIELGVAWQPIFPVRVEATLGVVVGRRIAVDDHRGRQVAEGDLAPQPVFSLGLQLTF